jgi:aspartyl-tRNA(Asn)/glutamyl-tRNA(Gln) amidotransferase subunit B
MQYEVVIGLEIHIELKTQSKIFCSCPTTFGAQPNTQICPVCMGMPGALPVLNGTVVEYAIKAGLATNCSIASYSKLDRKNYVYPDLPKAYQISQYDLPLCAEGNLMIQTSAGEKRVGITRIHIEEDAGKLVHDANLGTLFDCNRCGVPLIEIVSEPDMRSADEAIAFLEKLRATILYTGISDCKMNEGSLRCDVNLSVRPMGCCTLGTRTETKNLNSFVSVRRAIEFEAARQIAAIEAGEEIVQETRRFEQATGKTFSMRRKENANDYRYFPDPDLCAVELPQEDVERLGREIPRLPEQRRVEYMARFGLSAYDASLLTNEQIIADYFERAAALTGEPKLLANLLLGEVFRLRGQNEAELPIEAEHMAKLCDLIGAGVVNSSAGKRVLNALWEHDEEPEAVVDRLGLRQISDENELKRYLDDAIAGNPAAMADYRAGKAAAAQAIMGSVMKATGGRADPVRLRALMEGALKA